MGAAGGSKGAGDVRVGAVGAVGAVVVGVGLVTELADGYADIGAGFSNIKVGSVCFSVNCVMRDGKAENVPSFGAGSVVSGVNERCPAMFRLRGDSESPLG